MKDELMICPNAVGCKFRQREGCIHAYPHIRVYGCTDEYIVWSGIKCQPCEKFLGVVITKERSLEGDGRCARS
jgi:hypothetical protein